MATFNTTSSKSSTNKSLHASDTDIQYVKGVGPRLGAVFKSRGLSTVKDLLYFFPRAYEDRSRLKSIAEVITKTTEDESATLAVRVVHARKIPTRYGKSIFEVRVSDPSGFLSLKWFHLPRGLESKFSPGASFMVSGKIKKYLGHAEMIHPEITWDSLASTTNVGRVVPIYTELDGISSRVLRKVLWEALEKFSSTLGEDLPEYLLNRHQLPPLSQSVRDIHFPPENDSKKLQALLDFKSPSHTRLIYEEFLKFEYLVLKHRLHLEKERSTPFGSKGGLPRLQQLQAQLPFQLTAGQTKALQDIIQDLSLPHPMNRLIQGDVGSGKTVVALLSAALVLAENAQAALMAPTEILAEQHYKTAKKLFNSELPVALLTGKTPLRERQEIQSRLRSAEPVLLIGTHTLLEDPITFQHLGLILIDEQQRFGVEQRLALRKKGTCLNPVNGQKSYPHILILTATPIPRTLALTAYGDLAVTSIHELPKGRSPILTRVARDKSSKRQILDQIRKELQKGHQAYFIYPLVNDSEVEGFAQLKSVVSEAETLANDVFPEFKTDLLHGQLKPDKKAQVMERFKKNEIQILVATTVVEVGVDVPNATTIVIEHAERFGLSQLHQLRGRVGRGSSQSYCFLFSHSQTGETAASRLEVLEKTTDGFIIAEADLEIRGPGEFLGTRQAGTLPFKLANLVRDREWLLKAREDAIELLKTDSDLEQHEHIRLQKYFEREGNRQFERLKTS